MSRATTSRTKQDGVTLTDGVAAVIGIVAAATGVLHLLAARDHLEHSYVSAFFVVLALAQLAWGALVVWRRSPLVLGLGIVGNLAVVVVWALSRTTGLPLLDAVREVEPVGVADATASMLEVIAALGASMLAGLPAAAGKVRFAGQRGQRFVATSGAVAVLLLIPSFVTTGHSHGDHGHTHEAEALLTSDTHTHADGASGHTHDEAGLADGVAHMHEEAISGVSPLAGHIDGHTHAGTEVAGIVEHAHDDGSAAAAHVHAAGEPAHEHSGRTAPAIPPPPVQPPPRGEPATMLYGPFLLEPRDSGGMLHYNRILPIPAPCVNCLITSIKPDLVYADGTSANLNTGPMLHHTVLADPFRPDPTCGRDNGVGIVGHRLFAAGNERTYGMLPAGYGFANPSPMWIGIFEIMNHAPEYKVVFFKIDITSVPMGDPETKEVVPVWLDVDNCGDSQFGVPKGESHSLWRWKSTMTGRVVGTGGHVHDGGVSITLSNDTTKQRMCTSYAGYGTKPEYMGTVESMSVCANDRIGTVRAGENLLLDAYYNTRQAAGDVMGIMIAYIYETTDLDGGTPPPAAYTAAPQNAPPPVTGTAGGHTH